MRSITDCVVVLKPGDTIDLIGQQLSGYAIIPKDTFIAMGGLEHPAYLAAISARRAHEAAETAAIRAADREAESTPTGRIEALEREVAELREMIYSSNQ